MPVQTEGGHRVADIIVPVPEMKEGQEMERSGTEVTAFGDMTDEEAVTEQERGGGGVSRARLSSSRPRPKPLKCDPDPTRPPTLRRNVAGG